jgi:hypothetical protein
MKKQYDPIQLRNPFMNKQKPYWALVLVMGIFIVLGLTGCELDSTHAKDAGKNSGTNAPQSSTSSSGSSETQEATSPTTQQGSIATEDVSGNAQLTIKNTSSHHMWPSLEDRSLGKSLIKLSHVGVGESNTYTIPSGNHWLAIYSAESAYEYEATDYFEIKRDEHISYIFDGSLHRQ